MVTALLFSISGGMLAVLGTARLPDIAWKFLRLIGLLTLTMAAIATALSWRMHHADPQAAAPWILAMGATLGCGAMILSVSAPLALKNTGFLSCLLLLSGMAGIAASALSACINMGLGTSRIGTILTVLSQVLGAWLLGSITLAWLLGHAYLTATKMTIAPLRYFSRTLSAAVVARLLFLVAVIAIARFLQGASGPTILQSLEQWWLIALLRVGVGLVAVAIMTYMVADCVRLRSTQSATGILYFASVMAYVGELASLYLTHELGWPV